MGSYYHYRPIFSVVSVCHSVHRGYPCTGPHPSVQGSGTIHPVQGPSSDPSPPPTIPCTGHGHGHGHIQTFSYWTSLYTDPPNVFKLVHYEAQTLQLSSVLMELYAKPTSLSFLRKIPGRFKMLGSTKKEYQVVKNYYW